MTIQKSYRHDSIMLLGDAQTGKSSLFNQLTSQRTHDRMLLNKPTMGMSFATAICQGDPRRKDDPIKFQLIDTSGSHSWRTTNRLFLRKLDSTFNLLILVHPDVAEERLTYWIQYLESITDTYKKRIFVGPASECIHDASVLSRICASFNMTYIRRVWQEPVQLFKVISDEDVTWTSPPSISADTTLINTLTSPPTPETRTPPQRIQLVEHPNSKDNTPSKSSTALCTDKPVESSTLKPFPELVKSVISSPGPLTPVAMATMPTTIQDDSARHGGLSVRDRVCAIESTVSTPDPLRSPRASSPTTITPPCRLGVSGRTIEKQNRQTTYHCLTPRGAEALGPSPRPDHAPIDVPVEYIEPSKRRISSSSSICGYEVARSRSADRPLSTKEYNDKTNTSPIPSRSVVRPPSRPSSERKTSRTNTDDTPSRTPNLTSPSRPSSVRKTSRTNTGNTPSRTPDLTSPSPSTFVDKTSARDNTTGSRPVLPSARSLTSLSLSIRNASLRENTKTDLIPEDHVPVIPSHMSQSRESPITRPTSCGLTTLSSHPNTNHAIHLPSLINSTVSRVASRGPAHASVRLNLSSTSNVRKVEENPNLVDSDDNFDLGDSSSPELSLHSSDDEKV